MNPPDYPMGTTGICRYCGQQVIFAAGNLWKGWKGQDGEGGRWYCVKNVDNTDRFIPHLRPNPTSFSNPTTMVAQTHQIDELSSLVLDSLLPEESEGSKA